MPTIRYRSDVFPGLPQLQAIIEAGLSLSVPDYALHVDVTFSDPTFQPALDAIMARLGFSPVGPVIVSTPIAAFALRSPDASLWDQRVDNEGVMSLEKEGTGISTPVGAKNVYTEVAVDTSTPSVVFVDLLTAPVITTGGGPLLVTFTASASATLAGAQVSFRILVDGAASRGSGLVASAAGIPSSTALLAKIPLAAGPHTVKIQWRVSLGTVQIRPVTAPDNEHGSLYVQELPH